MSGDVLWLALSTVKYEMRKKDALSVSIHLSPVVCLAPKFVRVKCLS